MNTPIPPLRPAAQAVYHAITSYDPASRDTRWPSAVFDQLTRDLFAEQVEHNETYGAFCTRRAITPGTLEHIDQIPAVPTDVFKYARLASFSPGQTIRTFRTSGTTVGDRGAHDFRDLSVYRASLLAGFEAFMLHGLSAKTHRMIVLTASPQDAQDSSLSYMMGEVVGRWADSSSTFHVKRDPDSDQLTLDLDSVCAALDLASAHHGPVLVMGTAFAFMALFDSAPDRTWSLPAGSRVMETGGFKGKSREVSRATLYAWMVERFGVAAHHVVSEYSMTELSAQAYTDVMRPAPELAAPRALLVPPWVKLDVVDPLTLEVRTAPDATGLIRWLDLSNHDSVLAVQTSDFGTRTTRGLVLHGRAKAATLRGCSLTIEEILEASSPSGSANRDP
ncbi:MAG: hypothetical protein AAGI01_14175 [Myxococcota bacterium]